MRELVLAFIAIVVILFIGGIYYCIEATDNVITKDAIEISWPNHTDKPVVREILKVAAETTKSERGDVSEEKILVKLRKNEKLDWKMVKWVFGVVGGSTFLVCLTFVVGTLFSLFISFIIIRSKLTRWCHGWTCQHGAIRLKTTGVLESYYDLLRTIAAGFVELTDSSVISLIFEGSVSELESRYKTGDGRFLLEQLFAHFEEIVATSNGALVRRVFLYNSPRFYRRCISLERKEKARDRASKELKALEWYASAFPKVNEQTRFIDTYELGSEAKSRLRKLRSISPGIDFMILAEQSTKEDTRHSAVRKTHTVGYIKGAFCYWRGNLDHDPEFEAAYNWLWGQSGADSTNKYKRDLKLWSERT